MKKTLMTMLIAMLVPCLAAHAANNFAGDPNVILLMNFENNLDDASGQTVDNDGVEFGDYSPYARQGTYWALFGYDTATIQYANLDANMPLTSTGSGVMTICVWLDQTNNQFWNGLIAGRWDTVGGDNRAWMLYSQINDENLCWAVSEDGTSAGTETYDTGWKLYNNHWCHVALRWNNSTKGYDFRVWDNTDQQIEVEDSGTFSKDVDVSQTTDWTAGEQTDEATYGLSPCYMDELVVFDCWLTDEEIDKIRKGEYGASSGPPGFIGHILGRAVAPWEWIRRAATWREPDVSGQKVRSSSPNARSNEKPRTGV